MNTIILQDNGQIVKDGQPMTGDVLPVLNHAVSLDPAYSLRSFFRLLKRFPDLVRLSPFFPATIEQVAESPASGCSTEELDHLEFSKAVEMIGFPGDPRLEIFTSLKGVKSDAAHGIHSFGLGDLLDLPLRLGKLKHVIFGDRVDVFEFATFINLFEFIDGLAWELSFQNQPQQCEIRR
ncbi:MAG: hypothetical protein ACOWWM_00290 [Desulfobacterales bacterium]